MIFRENKDFAYTHRCTPRALVLNHACTRKMLLCHGRLLCCSEDPCLSHIGLMSRWNPDLISCTGMEKKQDRRFRKSTEPGVSSAPVSGGYFLLIPESIPLMHEASKKCSLVWCYRRLRGASALSPQAWLVSLLTLDWATEVQKLKCRDGWWQVPINLANFLHYVSVFVSFLLAWSCLF